MPTYQFHQLFFIFMWERENLNISNLKSLNPPAPPPQVGNRTERIQTGNSEKLICKCPPCNKQILIFTFPNFFEWCVYTTEACAAHRRIYTTKFRAEPRRVYTTEESASSGRVYIIHGVLCGSWRCLHTETCISPGDVYTTGARAASRRVYNVLLLDMSTSQRAVLHLDVSTPQRPELHLDLSTLQRAALLLELFTLQRP